MAHVRLAPDLVGPLGANELERDGSHRRHGGELDETLGLRVGELGRQARDGVEPRHEQTCGAVRSGVLGHDRIFAGGADDPAYGSVSWAQTFASSRSTAGWPSDAPKLIAPAANTLAPPGVS